MQVKVEAELWLRKLSPSLVLLNQPSIYSLRSERPGIELLTALPVGSREGNLFDVTGVGVAGRKFSSILNL